LQLSFNRFLDERFGALRRALKTPEIPAQGATAEEMKVIAAKNPGSFPIEMMLAQSLRKAGDLDGAIAALERAAALVPMATGASSPNVLIAAIARERKDNARAIAALEALGKV